MTGPISRTPDGQALLDALPFAVVVLSADGRITAVNQPWLQFCVENGGRVETVSPPADYLATCGATPVADGIQAVLDRQTDRFEAEYTCHTPTEERWFRMTATPVGQGALVVHLDITGEYARVSRWLATTPTTIIELTPDPLATFVNQTWARYMGAARHTLLGSG